MDAIEHFQAGRAALVSKRDELNRMIAEVDRMIAFVRTDLGGHASVTAIPSPSLAAGTGTVRNVLLENLVPGAPYRVPDMMAVLADHNLGHVQEDSVRGIVAKMKKAGLLASAGWGVYELAAFKNDTDPALDGASAAHLPE